MKKCPYCAEEVQDEAILCKHCHSSLITPNKNQPTSNQNQPSVATTSGYTTVDKVSSLKTTYFVLSLVFNVIAIISLLIPFIVISMGVSIYKTTISVSPLLGFINVFQFGEISEALKKLGGSNPLEGFFTFIIILSIILLIMSIIAIVNTIKGITYRHEYSIYMGYFKTSIILTVVINIIAILSTFIGNALLGDMYLLTSGHILFPVSALVFAIIGIVLVIVIGNFYNSVYYAEKYEKKKENPSEHNNFSDWICQNCGQSNNQLSLFCIECGEKK